MEHTGWSSYKIIVIQITARNIKWVPTSKDIIVYTHKSISKWAPNLRYAKII